MNDQSNHDRMKAALERCDVESLERLLELVREMVRINNAQAEREAEACN